jgi:hypothetical protein
VGRGRGEFPRLLAPDRAEPECQLSRCAPSTSHTALAARPSPRVRAAHHGHAAVVYRNPAARARKLHARRDRGGRQHPAPGAGPPERADRL